MDDETSSVPLIPFNRPPFFPDEFNRAIQTAVSAGHLSGDGLNSKRCERFFQTRFGFDHSLLTPSCTAALEMAALILALGPGDEVIVPSFTFVTSASAFALRGAKLIFADSEKEHPGVSVDDILSKVTDKTKAIVVVHYAGVPVDVDRILLETKNAIPVVEDCAHAICSRNPTSGDYVGRAGCLSTFSFHETKNVGIGEGGLLVVNDEALWEKAQIVREKGTNRTDFRLGRVAFYTWVGLGSSYLMSEVDASALIAALDNIDVIQAARHHIWDVYDREIIPSCHAFVKPKKDLRANAHMYFLVFHSSVIRAEFCKAMKDQNILVATHYLPLDASPFMLNIQKVVAPQETCNQAAAWSKSLVRLPLYFDLTDEELEEDRCCSEWICPQCLSGPHRLVLLYGNSPDCQRE